MANLGRVSQIIGPAVDVEFPEGNSLRSTTALHITSEGFDGTDANRRHCRSTAASR